MFYKVFSSYTYIGHGVVRRVDPARIAVSFEEKLLGIRVNLSPKRDRGSKTVKETQGNRTRHKSVHVNALVF